jgi:hypothetical protein
MERICDGRFRVGHIHTVEVWRGNAFSFEADVLVFGRCPALKAEISALAGSSWEPFALSEALARIGIYHRAETLSSARLPWKSAVSIWFRARNRDPLDPDALISPISRISASLWRILWSLHGYGAHRFVLLPLSWRNPDLVAAAMAEAIWAACVISGIKKTPCLFQVVNLGGSPELLGWLRNESGRLSQLLRKSPTKPSPLPGDRLT